VGVWHSEAFGWENDTPGGSILGFCRIAVEAYIMGAWPFDCSKSDNGPIIHIIELGTVATMEFSSTTSLLFR